MIFFFLIFISQKNRTSDNLSSINLFFVGRFIKNKNKFLKAIRTFEFLNRNIKILQQSA